MATIVDREDRIIVYLAGQPRTEDSWKKDISDANRAMGEAAYELRNDFSRGDVAHRRGKFANLRVGVTFGGGGKVPSNVGNRTDAQTKAAAMLSRRPSLQRIAGFASSAFALAAPRLFGHYYETVEAVCGYNPKLQRPFEKSVFPAATFNLGPQAVTVKHRDHANIPYGWCAITALGDFDPKLGGHLYLWELKIVVEFPPGSTVLIPSSIISHGNTPIQKGETRRSFTQYCAGGLMRWRAYGFRTEETLEREDPALLASIRAEAEGRWQAALGYFSKYGELSKDHASA
ncbi:hypothetical protein BV25DRAFT_1873282 [Artomyces pyxidatus]|uniref:Uncharacterized protein n=1 Tax=Artomyces pyxidatus TaxID=48021 RepID=A0ACB8SET1_9AGAM|nr:hypothetical protein BV25DRAFT_1873282 [Artomyces pyxidatus]